MSSVVDALQNPAVSIAVVLVFLVLVVSGFGFSALFGSLVFLVYLGVTVFMLWLLWRGVRALERIADAAEARSYEGFDD
jgi:hypothetical protein